MDRDVRSTAAYAAVESFLRSMYEPSFGTFSDAAELAPHPDGVRVAFTGAWWEALEGKPGSRIGLADVGQRAIRAITGGPHRDRAPAWAPDGTTLAFLSDRDDPGVHQLWLLGDTFGEAQAGPRIDGVAEHLAWSPDSRSVLLVVAGRGAELAGVQGSGAAAGGDHEGPSWLPAIDTGDAAHHWRRAWRVDVATGGVDQVSLDGCNVWEAAWAGPAAIAAVVSDGPSEDAWYDARLAVLDAATGKELASYRPPRQIGMPAGSPDGRWAAAIQALCSDRAVVCGDVVLLDATTGVAAIPPALADFDASHLAWRDASHLVVSGHRGIHTVVVELDVATGEATTRWESDETCGGRVYPAAWPLGGGDAIVLVREATDRPPELAVVRDLEPSTVHSFASAGTDIVRGAFDRYEPVEWHAPDGELIHGWLALPRGEGPFPMIVEVHGGPVWAFRNIWPARSRLHPLALSRGYALFLPNPHGSATFGQAFIEHVYGDLGGADTDDVLSGVDHVVASYPIDRTKIGVTGGSYGGYMTYVLTTHDTRFAATVALAPISDYYSTHWSCNIPEFVRRFLADEPENATGRYRDRSPLHDSARTVTPTLHATGALDRCAPPTQGEFFHRAMLEHGHAESVLVTYPDEGHGVLTYPAVIDFLTRVIGWFDHHLLGKGSRP